MRLIRPEINRSSALDNWLQDFFTDNNNNYWATSPMSTKAREYDAFVRGVRTDLFENADHFHAVMEVPGVKKEDLKVEIEHSVLTVSGKRTSLRPGGESHNTFSRSISIPDSVDSTKIQAELKDGLLLVSMPKDESNKVRSIDVK